MIYIFIPDCIADGNLADMLKDEDGMELPLMEDQSLYYLQQILDGVYFLHQSGFLHLDIKGMSLIIGVWPLTRNTIMHFVCGCGLGGVCDLKKISIVG